MINIQTAFRDYPYYGVENFEDAKEVLRQIAAIRKDDVEQIANLVNVFISGRKVGKVPSASNDVMDGDKIGDFNVTASYAYYLIDNAGTAEWRRVAVGSF